MVTAGSVDQYEGWRIVLIFVEGIKYPLVVFCDERHDWAAAFGVENLLVIARAQTASLLKIAEPRSQTLVWERGEKAGTAWRSRRIRSKRIKIQTCRD